MINSNRVWAEIKLTNLRDNLNFIRSLIPSNTGIIAVIKNDAYGHGAVRIAPFLLDNGAELLAVWTVEEGIELRNAGINSAILLLGEINSGQAEDIVYYNLTATVVTLSLASALNQLGEKTKRKIGVQVKIDVGMGNWGILIENSLRFIKKIKEFNCLEIEGIYTHLNAAYGGNYSSVSKQILDFNRILDDLKTAKIPIPLLHAASSMTFTRADATYDMIRLGIVLYGIPNGNTAVDKKLKPVMEIKSRIACIHEVKAGFQGGYGWSFNLSKASRIATISAGYGDLYFLHLLKEGQVLVNGKRAALLDKVCMDHCLADLSSVPEAKVGDEVVFLGRQNKDEINYQQIQKLIPASINAVFLCLAGRRVPRLYI